MTSADAQCDHALLMLSQCIACNRGVATTAILAPIGRILAPELPDRSGIWLTQIKLIGFSARASVPSLRRPPSVNGNGCAGEVVGRRVAEPDQGAGEFFWQRGAAGVLFFLRPPGPEGSATTAGATMRHA